MSAESKPPTPPAICTHHCQLLLEEAKYDCLASNATPKRSDYLSWDDYFMSVACLSSHRSKDPSNPTGACIVDNNQRVIGIGYNGFPRNCSDDLLPWYKNSDAKVPFLHTPQAYECHAEVNAILNKCSADVAGSSLYVKDFPCNECAKMIAQSRIREVVFIHDKHHDEDIYIASRIILQMSGVKLRQYKPTVSQVELSLPLLLEVENHTIEMNGSINNNTLRYESPKSVMARLDAVDDHTLQEIREHRALLRQEANWNATKSQKRTNYLSWDDYFMAMASLTAKRSKDPNTQVGACIVSPDQRILALGYNGFPLGCSDDALPWSRSGANALHTKYPYVCHAEVNAILNKCSADVKGATLYVALFPCNECAKTIIQAGIKEVVYLQDKYHDSDACRASRIMFGMAGVKLRNHVLAVDKDIVIQLV
jgi:dCMP deaminase